MELNVAVGMSFLGFEENKFLAPRPIFSQNFNVNHIQFFDSASSLFK